MRKASERRTNNFVGEQRISTVQFQRNAAQGDAVNNHVQVMHHTHARALALPLTFFERALFFRKSVEFGVRILETLLCRHDVLICLV